MFEALDSMNLHLRLVMHSTFMSKVEGKNKGQMSMTIMYCPLAHFTTNLHFWIMLHSVHWTKLNLLSTIY